MRVHARVEDLPGEGAALAALEEDARLVLSAARLEEVELSLVLTSDSFIQDLNVSWRGVDGPTDVLSFPQDDEVVLGDLVLSLPTARRQAAERGHADRTELRILLVHGLLHLLGYDHEQGGEELEEMAAAERKLLDRLGWPGSGLIDLARPGADG